ncbi:tRNA epoxyqueuosine(34) reductase QueG [Natroniella sulfidigena]|uniref:tRNA epoxyqueuosine(34) reductase QueG n=1 Tax=Natroniella sulfidigena TaxID=723921 RepID=UPI00200A7F68|nr:tRNA epoxyqueuosine(34) reductase QueG [Natroniella sulfidigena]MCK8816248.1 tRNA epoxyqueuosine(34) reductase QueG [Natroniella sulfidigena]
MRLTACLKEYAAQIGLDELKVTTATSFPQVERLLKELKERDYLSSFVKNDFKLITDPQEVLASTRSVIVVAMAYSNEDSIVDDNQDDQMDLKGKIARFAWGKDYHQVLGEKLEQLVEFLQREAEQKVEAVKFADTGPTVDRALARRAGIGWQGKNCNIIHPEYGSWIFLGGIITNLDLEIDSPIEDKCGDCKRCIEACPTGALEDGYLLNSNQCLGYITLSKGYIDHQDRKKIGTRLWGCDTCQEACPHNQEVTTGDHAEFKPQNLASRTKLTSLLKLTDESYQQQFGKAAMNWRGKRPIQRNAAIILGNLKDKRAIDDLKDGLSDPKPIVRAHSAWALAEIGVVEVIKDLRQALEIENDKQVKEDLRLALEKLNNK